MEQCSSPFQTPPNIHRQPISMDEMLTMGAVKISKEKTPISRVKVASS